MNIWYVILIILGAAIIAFLLNKVLSVRIEKNHIDLLFRLLHTSFAFYFHSFLLLLIILK